MDTSFLTVEAYDVLIGKTYEISDELTSEIGMMSSESDSEDAYIKNVIEYLNEIVEEPEDFLDYWNILDSIDIGRFKAKIINLIKELNSLLNIPYKQRTPPEV